MLHNSDILYSFFKAYNCLPTKYTNIFHLTKANDQITAFRLHDALYVMQLLLRPYDDIVLSSTVSKMKNKL